ncbi:MAG: hypothetical protein J6U54_22880 [Clostridiales bacterium]|nr:hypothetical protein [Clostridiales bacterium]
MSHITKLDESEIMGFTKMNSYGGTGSKAKDALDAYSSGLKAICADGFGADDESTAHEVINALQCKMEMIAKNMEDVDLMIDCLFEVIENEILEKEAQVAQTVLGG